MKRHIKDYDGMCADNEKHDWRLWKQQGSRCRFQCHKCSAVTKWEKTTVTQDIIVPFDAPKYHYWDKATVAELKAMAKAQGLTGYSKMKRDDLISLLAVT